MESLSFHHQQCVVKMEQLEQAGDVNGTYCDMVWDSLMCWDRTPGGAMAEQLCPDYISGFHSRGTDFAYRSCLENGTWEPNMVHNATDGWTNFTGCIDTSEPDRSLSVHLDNIELMTNIGYGFSLVSLVVAVLIMLASKRLHCKSNSLHINLFLAFILRAMVSFIRKSLFVDGVGFEKDILRLPDGRIQFIQEGTHWECKLLMTLVVYSVAVSLMWIFMEGLYLHMLVYRTLLVERNGVRPYVIVGWLTPLVYTIPWVLVKYYKDNVYCWTHINPYGYFWIIKGPIVLTIVVNFGFFINIVRVLCKRVKTLRNVQGTSHQFRKLAKFAVVLIPLFGVIYVAFAAYPAGLSNNADIIYLYCEMFYNSFQGFLLALLFCFLNEEVHNEIKRCFIRRRGDGFNTRSFLMSSWRKTSVSRSHNSTNMVESVSLRSSGIKDRNENNPVKYSSRHEINKGKGASYIRVDDRDGQTTTTEVA